MKFLLSAFRKKKTILYFLKPEILKNQLTGRKVKYVVTTSRISCDYSTLYDRGKNYL